MLFCTSRRRCKLRVSHAKTSYFLSLICSATIMKLYNIIRSDQLNIAELFMSKYKQ